MKEKVHQLISAEDINKKVKEIGKKITDDYKGEDVVLIGVLKGAIIFMSDLLKAIDSNRVSVDFIGLSSYEGGTKSKGIVKITSDLANSVEDKHVVVVEDIIDTGLTMDFLIKNLKLRKPKSVSVCTLLEKPSNITRVVPIDYKCFVIPDKFVIGYGLDYDERYRNLPFIGVLEFISE